MAMSRRRVVGMNLSYCLVYLSRDESISNEGYWRLGWQDSEWQLSGDARIEIWKENRDFPEPKQANEEE